MIQFRLLPDGAVTDGAISDDAVLALRRRVWPDGVIDLAEVEEVMAINDLIDAPSRAWIDFYVEAVTEFLLSSSQPHGFLSQMQADWLILRLDRDGRLDSPAKLELLVHLLEKCDGTPDSLKAYILVQIERAVVFGHGPTRGSAEPDSAGRITAEECALLRRVIFAPSGFGPARVSAEEAEMLFRIKDATLDGDNAPDWKTLFVQGVANYLQGWQGLAMPTAEQEAAHERFLASRDGGIGGFLGRMVRTSPNGFVSAVRSGGFGRRAPDRDVVAEARADYAVTPAEQRWLDAHVEADGQVDPLEAALIAFIREDAGR